MHVSCINMHEVMINMCTNQLISYTDYKLCVFYLQLYSIVSSTKGDSPEGYKRFKDDLKLLFQKNDNIEVSVNDAHLVCSQI